MTWWISKNTQWKKLSTYVISTCIFCGLFISYVQGFDFLSHIREQNTEHTKIAFLQASKNTPSAMYSWTKRPYCSPSYKTNVSIFMYHYIRPSHWDPTWSIIRKNSITPATFDTHMAYVHALKKEKKVHVWFLSELAKRQEEDCFPHENIFIFTSDDWWRDNYGYLFPTATKYGIKFNLGIIYEKTKPTNERIDPFSSTEEVQEMSNHPLIEIQSHSMTHADLRSLSYKEQTEEVCFSKQWLEDLLGIQINTFIAPHGGISTSLPIIAKTCGYTYALSTKSWTTTPGELQTRPYDLERVRVNRNSTPEQLFWK
jgi:peptidoglycan/xylan/chitin deacetylase (PgdA/CDA1 family)